MIKYFKIYETSLYTKFADNRDVTTNYFSVSVLVQASRALFKNIFFQICSIPSISQHCTYVINVEYLQSFSVNQNILVLNFKDGEILNIDLLNDYDANVNYDYVRDIHYSHNRLYLIDRNILTVDSRTATSIQDKVYNTWTECKENLQGGELVIFAVDDYAHLGNLTVAGVDLYFPEGCTVAGADIISTSKIFGRAIFTNLVHMQTSDNIYSYFECLGLRLATDRIIAVDSRKVRIKALTSLQLSETFESNFDQDTDSDYIDVDIFQILSVNNSNGENFFNVKSHGTSYYTNWYIRNAFIFGNRNTFNMTIDTQVSEIEGGAFRTNLINCFTKNNRVSAQGNISIFTATHSGNILNIYNSHFRTPGNFILENISDFGIDVYFYGKCYSTKPLGTSQITAHDTHNFIIDNNLNYTEDSLIDAD